jgi:hypothetical protein
MVISIDGIGVWIEETSGHCPQCNATYVACLWSIIETSSISAAMNQRLPRSKTAAALSGISEKQNMPVGRSLMRSHFPIITAHLGSMAAFVDTILAS